MFKIPFLQKKEKINLTDLRNTGPSPSRDWKIILTVFLGTVVFFCAISVYLFLKVYTIDPSRPDSRSDGKNGIIDQAKLNKAVQFINSRQN